MKLFGRSLEHDPVVVAEIGVNHEGSVEVASELLRLAAEAGAAAVKFQTYTPARFASASDPGRLERVSKFALTEAEFRRLASEAAERGVGFISTPVTEDVVPFLDELCPAFKIASGDLTFEPVIRAAAETGKPILLSTGLGTLPEIDATVGWVRDVVGAAELPERLVLLQCVVSYPTPLDQVNVRSVPFLADRYGVPVGYSHHAQAMEACLAAVALGACLVEVHFTDRKTDREFRDHALSCEPSELAGLVESVRNVHASLGSFDKVPQEAELPNRQLVRKGIVAARDLAAATVLSDGDLMYARPATEFAAHERSSLIGRRLLRELKTGELIPRDSVD